MYWFSLGFGAALVVVTLLDVIWTSMWVGGGAGPMTRLVANSAWRVLGLFGHRRHKLMRVAGPLVLTLTVVAWLFALWLGWVLIFSADPASVLTTSTDRVSNIAERTYFAGYTIFTLGNGDFSPNGAPWQIATVLAVASGLFIATLAFTYIVSVVSAAVNGRAFASQVWGLGASPAQVVADAWVGGDYRSLSFPLQSISSQLSQLSQQYLAYPVLQYFHAERASSSPIVALAQLDQILMVSAHAVSEERQAPKLLHSAVRSGIEDVLDALAPKFVNSAEQPLPTPQLEELNACGLETLSNDEFTTKVISEQDRRKKLRGLLQAHGWTTEDLIQSGN